MPTAYFPAREGELYTQEQFLKMRSSKRTYFRCARKYTNKPYKIIESSPSPVYLVVCGLDGFSREIIRILSCLASLQHTSYFIILVSDQDTLPNDGVGLVDGRCSSGYYTICFFSDDPVAGTSDKVKLT
jgi:hypothetical protein